MKVNLLKLMDENACYDFLREIRWADGVQCPHCSVFRTILAPDLRKVEDFMPSS